MEKFEYVAPTFDEKNQKWDNISIISKISNDKIVLNNKVIIPVNQHYFYVKDEFGDYTSIFGDRLSKKTFGSYSAMYNSKKSQFDYKDVFESNLKPIRRWMIDNVTIPMSRVPLNKMYLDIETDYCLDTLNTPKPITAISTFSNKLMRFVCFIWKNDFEVKVEKYDKGEFIINIDNGMSSDYPVSVYYFDNEYDMMSSFVKYCDDIRPVLYLGWSSNNFDLPFIIRRCALIGIDYKNLAMYGVEIVENKFTEKEEIKMNGAYSLDLLDTLKVMTANDLDSYKLGTIATEILGDETKLEIEMKDAWHFDPEALLRYNLQDVNLLLKLDKKLGMTDFMNEKRLITGCEWEDVFQNSKIVDVWFLRKAKELGIILPDPKYGYTKEGFAGAFVRTPLSGLYVWIIALDLASLYPSIIQQFNISPDTFDDGYGINAINLKKYGLPNYKNHKEKIGFIPQTITELQLLRKKYKNEMKKFVEGTIEYKIWDNKQFTTKSLINSIYGVLGYSAFRLYDKRLAESVTGMGQEIIKYTNTIIEECGFKVIYNDTDSSYIQINVTSIEEAVKIGNELRDRINNKYNDFVKQLGCEKNTNLSIEFESVYRQFFIPSDDSGEGLKKRYAYEQIWKNGVESHKIGFKGFDVVRSNASPVTKEVQQKLFDILFDMNIDKKDKKKVFETWLKDFKKDVKAMKYGYKFFSIPQKIGQRLSEYKVTNPQVRASEYSNQFMGTNIGVDSKINLIYIKNINGSPDTKEICFEDESDFIYWMKTKNVKIDVDWDLMFEKLIEEKTKNIYKTLNWANIGQNTLSW